MFPPRWEHVGIDYVATLCPTDRSLIVRCARPGLLYRLGNICLAEKGWQPA
jgi:hypothetical protein